MINWQQLSHLFQQWAFATIGVANTRVGETGPAYLYYTGCSISASAQARARDDFSSRNRLVTSLLSLWKVRNVDVFEVNLPRIGINRYEYRSTRALQTEEHSLISARYPRELNSAPGGLIHDFSVDVYPAQPWPDLGLNRETVPPTVTQAIKRHF